MENRRFSLMIVLVVILLAGAGCSRGIVPDDVLSTLHKPLVSGINPSAVRSDGCGFTLKVNMLALLDPQYVLYIDGRRIGQRRLDGPGVGSDHIDWDVSRRTLAELFAASPQGGVHSVRVTSISEEYDISDDFDRYGEYVSDPLPLAIGPNGTSFTPARRLFPGLRDSYGVVIRCDPGGGLYLAWQDKGGDGRIRFSRSSDNGDTWTSPLDVLPGSMPSYGIDMAVDGAGHAYLVWDDWEPDGSDIYFCRSLDHGHSWEPPQRLQADRGWDPQAKLAVDDRGGVVVAWRHADPEGGHEPGIRLAVSRDLGNTWATRDFVLPPSSIRWHPLLFTRPGGMIGLLQGWFRENEDTLRLRLHSSRDYGVKWREEEAAVSGGTRGDEDPRLRIGPEGQMGVVWNAYDYRGRDYGQRNYFLGRDGDGSWGRVQDLRRLCPSETLATALSVSPAGADIVLTGYGCLFLIRSPDAGLSWSGSWSVPEAVTGSDGRGFCRDYDMALHPSGRTYLAFVMLRSGEQKDYSELYLSSFE